MATSPFLGLNLYDLASGSATTFLDFRLAVTGNLSNMTIIDTFSEDTSASISSLRGSVFQTVSASESTSNNYHATVGSITSYATNMVIILRLNTSITGATTININSFGDISLKKINSSGDIVDISSGDLLLNQYYLFQYNGTYFIWIGSVGSTSGSGAPTDALYIVSGSSSLLTNEKVITAGSNITLDSSGSLLIVHSGSSISAPSDSPFITTASALGITNYSVLTAGSNISLDLLSGSIIINSLSGSSSGSGIFEPASWTVKTAMPVPSADVPVVSYNEKIYLFGGYQSGATVVLNDVQVYTPTTDSWDVGTDMPTSRWGAAAAEIGGVVYVFGGAINSGETGSAKCEAYDIIGDSWTTKTDVPSGMDHQGLMAVTVGTKIYLIYGQLLYEFDPEGSSGSGLYTSKTNAPVVRTWATWATVSVDGEDRIYFIGGWDGSGGTGGMTSNYYYKPSDNSWSASQTVAPYASWGQTRDNPVIDNKIYYGFGQHPAGTYFAELRRYDPATDTWETLADASYARDGLGCAVVDRKLYCFGGRVDTTAYDYNEVYTPSISSNYAVLDATTYPDLHTNDTDTGGGIHHTLGTGATQAAAGDHTHAAGTGDVVGPAGAIDGHIAVFDGATGKLLKDGGTSGSGTLIHTYYGYNSVGGSSVTMTAYRWLLKKITIANAGMLLNIGAYVLGVADQVHSFGVGLLDDNSGSPGKIIAYNTQASTYEVILTAASQSIVARWIAIPVTCYLAPGDYWLAFCYFAGSAAIIYYDGSGTDRYYSTAGNRWLADGGFYSDSDSGNNYSIRASVIS